MEREGWRSTSCASSGLRQAGTRRVPAPAVPGPAPRWPRRPGRLAAGICSPAHPSRSPARHARAASSRSRARRTRSSFVGRERALGSTATCARRWSGPTTRRGRLPDGHPHHVRARRSRAGDGVTSPVMVPTLQDRAGQLAALGWTGHEAEWLALVALHSGVFTQSGAKVHHDSRRPPAAWRAVDRPCAPGVVVRPAGAAGEPSRRDTYGRERPHRRGKGSDTVPDTVADTHPSPCRSSGTKGGVAPVLSLTAGAVRERRARTKDTNNDSAKTTGGVVHPPRCSWYTPRSVCVPFCSTPAVTPS